MLENRCRNAAVTHSSHITKHAFLHYKCITQRTNSQNFYFHKPLAAGKQAIGSAVPLDGVSHSAGTASPQPSQVAVIQSPGFHCPPLMGAAGASLSVDKSGGKRERDCGAGLSTGLIVIQVDKGIRGHYRGGFVP